MFLFFLFRNPIVNLGTGILVYPTTHVIQEGPKIFHITSGTYKQPWRTWGIRGEDLLLFGQQIEGEHRNKREVMWMCYVDCCLFLNPSCLFRSKHIMMGTEILSFRFSPAFLVQQQFLANVLYNCSALLNTLHLEKAEPSISTL